MTDPSTGQPAVTRILDQQEAMQDKLASLQSGQARIETKIDTMCEQRREQHNEHLGCLAQRESAFESNAGEHDRIWAAINRLTTWGKAIAILGSTIITILTILNILLSIGVKL